MSYAKQTHVAGQKLTAAQLNHMENGIVAAHNVYNLLDNSDFRNPINQRGKTTYTGSGYAIDRWRSWADTNTLTINDGYITTIGDYNQYINGLGEGVYSAFAKKTDGTIVQLKTGYEAANNKRYVTLKSGSYVWAALYEGAYTADTLPAYVPKGYGAELMECQRYYQQYSVVGLTCRNNGYATTLLPVTMRVAPTVSIGTRRLYTTSYEDVSGTYPNTLGANTTSIFFNNSFYEGFVTITCNDVSLSADL